MTRDKLIDWLKITGPTCMVLAILMVLCCYLNPKHSELFGKIGAFFIIIATGCIMIWTSLSAQRLPKENPNDVYGADYRLMRLRMLLTGTTGCTEEVWADAIGSLVSFLEDSHEGQCFVADMRRKHGVNDV